MEGEDNMAVLEVFDKIFVIINLFLQNGFFTLVTILFILLVIAFVMWGLRHGKKI